MENKILIVEDDAVIAQLLYQFLTRSGFQAITSPSAEELRGIRFPTRFLRKPTGKPPSVLELQHHHSVKSSVTTWKTNKRNPWVVYFFGIHLRPAKDSGIGRKGFAAGFV